jgi:hypothetical protein
MIIEVWEWDKNSSHDFLAAAKMNIQSALGHDGEQFALEVIRKGASIPFTQLTRFWVSDCSIQRGRYESGSYF